MANAIWAGLGLIALLWPSRLAGPFDGAPLDFTFEAIAAAVAGVRGRGCGRASCATPAAAAGHRRAARRGRRSPPRPPRWTAGACDSCRRCRCFARPGACRTAGTCAPTGATPMPRCSAIMRRGYTVLEEFPVWFYNLPPVHEGSPAQKVRSPAVGDAASSNATDTSMRRLTGRCASRSARTSGCTLRRWTTADRARSGDRRCRGAGRHFITSCSTATCSDRTGRLRPLWNGRDLWSALAATTTSPTTFDRWLRPWAGYVPALLLAVFLVYARCGGRRARGEPACAGVRRRCCRRGRGRDAIHGIAGRDARRRADRCSPPRCVRVPRRIAERLRRLAADRRPVPRDCSVARACRRSASSRWYSSGDDWWMFQRYAYRIFMEGYWLEGGQLTFWFQPFYRWITGGLHMVFGDSSVGELFWDAACARHRRASSPFTSRARSPDSGGDSSPRR